MIIRKDCPSCGVSSYWSNEKVGFNCSYFELGKKINFTCSYCKTNLNNQPELSIYGMQLRNKISTK